MFRSNKITMPTREIVIQGEDMKFSCAHFVAFKGFRERLHGHNYTVKLTLEGQLGPDGYVLDFAIVKKALRASCKALNEYLIVPMQSDVLNISIKEEQIEIIATESGSFFSLPAKDCVLLPIAHSTAEELAEFLWCELIKEIGVHMLRERGVRAMEVFVFERQCQGAGFKKTL
jgi:6-pyruvoyl-tetrahydropterin synthase